VTGRADFCLPSLGRTLRTKVGDVPHWDSRVVGANHDRIPTAGDRAYGEGRIFVGENKGGLAVISSIQEWNWRLPVPTARVLPAICQAQGQEGY